MATILVPVDFSSDTDNLIRYAIELAKIRSASLLLLNVYPLPIATPEMPAEMILADEIRDDASQRLETLCESYRNIGITVESKLVAGSPGTETVYLAEHINPELIVMGTRSTAQHRNWLGSNTLHVLDRARFPLLIVPSGVAFRPWKQVVCGTDFNFHEIDAITHAASWINAFHAELTLVHVDDGGSDEIKNTDAYRASFVEKVRNLSGVQKIDYNFIAERKDVLDRLQDFSVQHNADVMLMLHKVRKGLARLFERSLTKAMAHDLPVPLLSYPVVEAAVSESNE